MREITIGFLFGVFMGGLLIMQYLEKTDVVLKKDYKDLKTLIKNVAFENYTLLEKDIITLLDNDDVLSKEQREKIELLFKRPVFKDIDELETKSQSIKEKDFYLEDVEQRIRKLERHYLNNFKCEKFDKEKKNGI